MIRLEDEQSNWHRWVLQRRDDGAILVRVPSDEADGRRLPDAVFSFRDGDPQYAVWAERLAARESQGSSSCVEG